MRKHTIILAAMAGIGLAAASTQASVVAYYQADGSMASAVNSPAQDATKTHSATYVSDTPGGVVFDGVGGPVANASNTQSYGNGSDASGSSAPYAALNTAISTGSFTIEAFIKLNPTGSIAYDTIIGNGWAFGLNNNGYLQFGATQVYLNAAGAEYAGAALSRDEWHHVAVVGTYDGPGKVTRVQLYEDYVAITPAHASNFYGTAANGPTMVVNASDIKIGAPNPVNGLLDEIRITNTALMPNQMLHVPEPGTLALCGLMGTAGLLRRRRKPTETA